MKICFLGNVASLHVQRWAKFFMEKGSDVHIISTHPPLKDYNILTGLDNVNVYILKKKQLKFGTRIINFFFQAYQANKLIKAIKPEILHSHFARSASFLGTLSCFHPYLISIYGADVFIAPRTSLLVRIILPLTLKKADILLTTAKFMKSYLNKNFKVNNSKIIRIPWGINVDIFRRNYIHETIKLRSELILENNDVVVLSNRGLKPVYNYQYLMKAIPSILKEYPNTIFIFLRGAGYDPKFETKLKKEAIELNVSNNIRFIERTLDPFEMAVYLNISHIFVSIPNTDQFGSSVLEGMACGVVPLVSKIEVYKQYLTNDENAYFVNPEDPIDISEGIKKIMKNLDNIRELCLQINREIVLEKENAVRNNEKMYRLYKNLVANNNSENK